MKITNLTNGERLLVRRMRRKESQRDAAARYGVTHWAYGQWERDAETGAPKESVGRLQDNEKCVLARRRAGVKQSEVAANLGRSKYWIRLMENGSVDCYELVQYWGARS